MPYPDAGARSHLRSLGAEHSAFNLTQKDAVQSARSIAAFKLMAECAKLFEEYGVAGGGHERLGYSAAWIFGHERHVYIGLTREGVIVHAGTGTPFPLSEAHRATPVPNLVYDVAERQFYGRRLDDRDHAIPGSPFRATSPLEEVTLFIITELTGRP